MAPEISLKDPEFVQLVEIPPGGALRQARQALNYGQLDVARRMNLTVEVINALEENRFSDLPEATYVKGYLRSYARFLEIDSDPLISAYEELVLPEHGSAASSSVKSDRVQSATLRWGLLAIAGVLLLMFVSWWINVQPPTPEASKLEESQSVEARQTATIEREATLSEASEQATKPSIVETESDDVVAKPSTEETMRTDDVVAKPSTVETMRTEDVAMESAEREDKQAITEPASGAVEPSSVQTASTATREAAAEESATEESASTTTQEQETAVETAPSVATGEAVSDASAGPTPGKDELTMVFSAQSWTEVYDADEQRLLFDLVESGSVRNLQGTAPFNVRLGNSSGVEISINGRLFNHSQFSRQDNTARFNVDRPSQD